MFRWVQRLQAAEVRLGVYRPEHDTVHILLARALSSLQDALATISHDELAFIATELRRETVARMAKTLRATMSPVTPIQPLAQLSRAFVGLCAAYGLDPEQVIEDAIQKYEAQKTPVAPASQPTAPTAREAQGTDSRPFTL